MITLTFLRDADDEIKDEVADDIGILQTDFKSCYPERCRDAFTLVRNAFCVAFEQLDDKLQDVLIALRKDSSCRDLSESVLVTEFCIEVSSSYPKNQQKLCWKTTAFYHHVVCVNLLIPIEPKIQAALQSWC